MLTCARSLEATHTIAARIARLARVGDMIVLAGEMGAGKTAFAQGFGRALGVTEPITSPTFTLVHGYDCDKGVTLHHADLYRLDRTTEIEDLALHELAAFGGIVLIEWGDVAGAGLGAQLEVHLDVVEAPDDDGRADDFGLNAHRRIDIKPIGSAWASRWDRLVASLEAFRC